MVRTAIILAAGSGKRIGLSCPKGLITIGNETLIERSIKILIENGIENVYIGTGYEAEQYDFLEKLYPQVSTQFNENHATMGSFSTLFKTILHKHINEDVLVLDSDIVYESESIGELKRHTDAILVSDVTGSGDEVFVTLNSLNKVCSLSKKNQTQLESIGICHLSDFSVKRLKSLAGYLSHEYDPLLATYLNLSVVKTEHKWCEIDNLEMHESAQKLFGQTSFLSPEELNLKSKWKKLKSKSGSHSPSIGSIEEMIGREIIDLCFLSNPYATKLFQNKIVKLSSRDLQKIIEYYPSQNAIIAEKISKRIGVPAKNIFVGNGAIEPIQVIVQSVKSIAMMVPTFSSYYEYASPGTQIFYYNLQNYPKTTEYSKSNENYDPNGLGKKVKRLNPVDYVHFLNYNKVELGVIINPNNPDGSYIEFEDLIYIIEHANCKIVVDESFVHFAAKKYQTAESIFENYSNLYIVKSLSKDFGVSGLRCGYAIMSEKEVSSLLSNGYLWNVNGFAEYFYNLFSQDEFYKQYEKSRIKYINESREFFKEVSEIEGLHAYESAANFILVDPKMRSDDFSIKLLNKGILVRDCSDKIGLRGNFVRISSKDKATNAYVIQSIKEIYE